jgi:hypothetical protein
MLFRGQPGARAVLHPKTGKPIVPLGYRDNGSAIWPILGASPDDDDDAGGDDGGSDADDADKNTGDDDDRDDSGDDDDDDTVSRAEFDRVIKRMKQADKRANAAEAKVKEAEDAQKDEITRVQDENKELKEQNETLQSERDGLRLENAFLTANKQDWHDPETALGIARSKKYLDEVVDEDSGEIDKVGLGKALDRLAKDHAYLVKSKDSKKSDDGDDDSDDDVPSGASAGRRSDNSKDGKAREAALHSRFSSLQR